jgi:hypothetical protein
LIAADKLTQNRAAAPRRLIFPPTTASSGTDGGRGASIATTAAITIVHRRRFLSLLQPRFFKPVHVKSLPAHAIRSLIIARKKLVGQRVTLENQIRGLAVVFGVRLPRALTAAFIN